MSFSFLKYYRVIFLWVLIWIFTSDFSLHRQILVFSPSCRTILLNQLDNRNSLYFNSSIGFFIKYLLKLLFNLFFFWLVWICVVLYRFWISTSRYILLNYILNAWWLLRRFNFNFLFFCLIVRCRSISIVNRCWNWFFIIKSRYENIYHLFNENLTS